MLGGMLLPSLYGMMFLGDAAQASHLSLVCRMAGVVLLVVSMVFPCLDKTGSDGAQRTKKQKLLFIALCLIVFVMNGFVSILSKLHQIEANYPITDNNSFVFLTNTLSGIFSAFLLFVLVLKNKQPPKLAKGFHPVMLIAVVVGYALCNGVSYLLQLTAAASDMPASVQYPMLTGGSVVLTALAGYLCFHEKPSKNALIGTLLAFAATFLFLF